MGRGEGGGVVVGVVSRGKWSLGSGLVYTGPGYTL